MKIGWVVPVSEDQVAIAREVFEMDRLRRRYPPDHPFWPVFLIVRAARERR